jgi:hypothetical protein
MRLTARAVTEKGRQKFRVYREWSDRHIDGTIKNKRDRHLILID